MFEWDEAKRQQTIKDRGLDFLAATRVFDGRPVITAPAKFPFEPRFVSTAMLDDGKFYSVVWMWRGDVRRIISFRRAWNGEERTYRSLHG